ncbi:MAG: efflux RND transporter periplasmic adaptor subunit [Fimbriimonas sp.]|nr:efflux RND transporter periplasmic adaptor subunit [Fimbriimonas sp.]
MAALGILGPILLGCGSPAEPKAEVATPKIVHTQVARIDETEVSQNYEATGTVKAALNATLASKVMGRIVAVSVHDGDAIRQGQTVASIDPRELKASVDMASATYRSSVQSMGNASTIADMEAKTSQARIAQAESQVRQCQAALAAAEARRDLAVAGPRRQEVTQSHLAVMQAESNMALAQKELARTTKLVQDGALAKRELDLAQNRFDLAKGQYDIAVQSENISREGSRSQEIKAAKDEVAQARASLEQAKAGVMQARAASLQTAVRRKEVDVARAQVAQTEAALRSAQVGLSYSEVLAPFDGKVVQRLVDPGSMASPGSPLVTVEGGTYRLEAKIPERFLASLKGGNSVSVRLDALAGPAIDAKVAEIVPQADMSTHEFLVKFDLPNQPAIRSGMFGRASIHTGSAKRILIPAASTWTREGLQYVFAVSGEGIARLRIVTLGTALGGKVEVLSGLNPGDRIVVGDRSDVSDGAKIEDGQR